MFAPIIFGLFGLIIGSFLNVFILRWKERPLTGRSTCASCGNTIAWYDLIPVISWLVLRGRCRICGTSISIQYPLVESATGIIFLAIAFSPLPILFKLLALPIAALLIAIAVYDLYHTIIPDAWVFTLAALSFLASITSWFFAEQLYFLDLAWLLAAGPIAALPLFFLWSVSRGAWMGFGDVKFAFAMGLLLGALEGFLAVVFAFVLGALVSVPLLFFSSPAGSMVKAVFTPKRFSRPDSRAYTMKSEIAFGPFLVASTLIVWISNMYGLSAVEALDAFSAALGAMLYQV